MSAKGRHPRRPIGLGVRAGRGGAVVVGVILDRDAPRVVRSTWLPTAADGDRLALEPFHVAAAMERGPAGGASAEAVAAVAEGRRRQDAMAEQRLREMLAGLARGGYRAAVAALLVNRAGWVSDLLAHALSSPDHPAVMEGLAVREALRTAFARVGLAAVEMDEKSMPELALARVGGHMPPSAFPARLKDLGAGVGRPWRKEQKLACLAAWMALHERNRC